MTNSVKLKKINNQIHKHMQWDSDQKVFKMRERWKSYWPEIKLIREGRASEVAKKLKASQFHWSYTNLVLHGDCDDWAMTAAEACLEHKIADPQFIGIALVLTAWGQKNTTHPYDHAIMVISLDEGENWLTIDSQVSDLVSDTYMGHKYHKVVYMDDPSQWYGVSKLKKG